MADMDSVEICSKCGRILENGICPECGSTEEKKNKITKQEEYYQRLREEYEKNTPAENWESGQTGTPFETDETSTVPPIEPENRKVKHRRGAGFLILTVLLEVLFLIVIMCEYSVTITDIAENIQSFIYPESGSVSTESEYTGNLCDVFYNNSDVLEYSVSSSSSKEVTFDDEDYYDFADYYDPDAGYTIDRAEITYSNPYGYLTSDAGALPTDLYLYANVAKLSDTGLEDEDYINSILVYEGLEGTYLYEYVKEKLPEGTDYYVEAYTYVTYYDEDVLSLATVYQGYYVTGIDSENAKYTGAHASLISENIDMKTGERLSATDLFNIDEAFVDEFVARCDSQNSTVVEDVISKDDLLNYFTNGELEWFYTPMGIEFGVSYSGFAGYCTYTEHDRSKYEKVY